MASVPNPAATDHIPIFVTAPNGTDVLMGITAIFLVGMILLTGLVFFRLHTLPERMAHKSQKLQFEIVAVLGLISLFTHEHLYWIAGLLLAYIELPDFGTPLGRMADSLEKIAGARSGESTAPAPETDVPPAEKEGSLSNA